MEALELLGSRYIKPEQVSVGPVETLRAQNAATWRMVFIHRISTTQEAAEQANLLKLLTTALVRSSEAKRLVLDFGEEQGFWNVVTENEPQCESLRDWLQAEVDGAEKGEAILSAEQAAAMGEFARLFARGVKQTMRPAIAAKAPKAPIPPPPEQKAPEPAPVVAEAETAPPAATPTPAAEQPLAVAKDPVPVPPVVEEIAAAPEPRLPESEIPATPQQEKPIAVPDEIPVIVMSAPPPAGKAMAATQSIGESKPPLEGAPLPPRTPLPPRSFTPRPPPLVLPADPPVTRLEPAAPGSFETVEAKTAQPPPFVSEPARNASPAFTDERGSQAAPGSLDALPVFSDDPLIPEIVTELPKAVADPPKVVPIDGRHHEPKAEAAKQDAIRPTEPPITKSAGRGEPPAFGDAPLFAHSMPKRAPLSKMAIFFIILGVVALLLVLVILYLSNKT
jgi:hypothetical protein